VIISEVEKRRVRLQRVVDVFERACCLGAVVISWKEVPRRKEEEEESGAWEVREQVLGPLERLRGVRFLVGDCVGSTAVEEGLNRFIRGLDSRSETTKQVPCGGGEIGSSARREPAAVNIPLLVHLVLFTDGNFRRRFSPPEKANTSAHHKNVRRKVPTLTNGPLNSYSRFHTKQHSWIYLHIENRYT